MSSLSFKCIVQSSYFTPSRVHLLHTYVFLFMNCYPNCVEAGVDDFVFLSLFKFSCVFCMLGTT